MGRNVVVMGGSFNPPTIAHQRLMVAALDAVRAEAGYLVPVSHEYLKRKMRRAGTSHLCLPDDVRLRMLDVLSAQDARIHTYEEDLGEVFSDTARTMARIQGLHVDASVWFVMGSDKLELLEKLTRDKDFLPRFGVVLFARDGEVVERQVAESAVLAPWASNILVVKPPEGISSISSTAVRRHLFEPERVAYMLHPEVLEQMRRLRSEDFPPEVLRFTGDHAFLGNLYEAPVVWDGETYRSAENAFQASKLTDPARRRAFQGMKPANARQRGNGIVAGEDWEDAKLRIMCEVVRSKFEGNPELGEQLVATGAMRLLNGAGKDEFWGINLTTWQGRNHLGEILMEVREELRGGGI